MAIVVTSFFPDTLDRMVRAVELVKQRLLRTAKALDDANLPYAIVGGNCVGAWVTQVGGEVRTTADVDVAIYRDDFARVRQVMESAGFIYENVWEVDCFLDSPTAKPSQSVRLLYAGERVRPTDLAPFPTLDDTTRIEGTRYLGLTALVTAKLTSFRDKDKGHLRDLIGLDLVDEGWLAKLPSGLAGRLKFLFDNPE